MSWALAGRITVWIILILIAYALFVYAVARLIAWRARSYPVALPRDPMKYEGRDLNEAQLKVLRGGDENEWQQRARRAEALGFREDEDSGPWVA